MQAFLLFFRRPFFHDHFSERFTREGIERKWWLIESVVKGFMGPQELFFGMCNIKSRSGDWTGGQS